MKIGIIGAGNIGGNLTRRLTHLGYDVAVANSRGPETLSELVQQTGARAVSASEAAMGADVVVVTIPEKNVPNLPAGFLAGANPGAIVIDTGNYYPQQRDGLISAIEDGTTESRWVSEEIGHPVVKAFNGIYAANLIERARPDGASDRMALPVAGDDATAKKIVMDLVDSLGFDPVDAGSIDDSWRQQPGTPVYGLDADANGVRLALAAAHNVRSVEWRAQ
ncbi:MAG: NAD(P)-binding domain-containing protein [Acidimicrobiaceae bacterium]|nr:NAD(P)-binding domain-containing protein [Acidimicrobiaceae bacterium]